MHECTQAKFIASKPNYAILAGLPPVYLLALNLTSQTIPALPRSHPHTIRYNFSTIPGPAPATVTQKYQHLQEQTPNLSEHHHIPQDSWEEGEQERGAGGEKAPMLPRRKEWTYRFKVYVVIHTDQTLSFLFGLSCLTVRLLLSLCFIFLLKTGKAIGDISSSIQEKEWQSHATKHHFINKLMWIQNVSTFQMDMHSLSLNRVTKSPKSLLKCAQQLLCPGLSCRVDATCCSHLGWKSEEVLQSLVTLWDPRGRWEVPCLI